MATVSTIGFNRSKKRPSVRPRGREARTGRQYDEVRKTLTNIRRFLVSGPSADINNVNFSLFSWRDLMDKRPIIITTANDDGWNSINSTRTGTYNTSNLCSTCSGDVNLCPGHIGIIEFSEPIVHPARYFVSDITNILKSVCGTCGTLILDHNTINSITDGIVDESKRLKIIAAESEKSTVCPNNVECNRMKGIGSEINDNVPYFYYNGKKRTPLPASKILEIFDNISDIDARILGFEGKAHPRNLILQGIPVMPPCSRPPVVTSSGEMKSSIITDLYNKIITKNNELRTSKNKDTTELSIAVYNLMFRRSQDGNSQDNVSIKTKITNKDSGVIRGINQGTNIINAARSVVVCDPTLKFGEIGFPRALAERMSVSETVDSSNITRLNTYLKKGLIKKYRPLSDPNKNIYEIHISDKNRDTITFNIGDQVDRAVMEGDFALAFRQPVLTKLSMLGDRIVFRDSYTFACHMAETAARNMDFDGDEVNAHVPYNIQSMDLVANYVSSRVNIMDPRNNVLAMAVLYDGLISIYLMMTSARNPTNEEFSDLLSSITTKDDFGTLGERANNLGVTNFISYNMLFSALLPAGFYYKKQDVVIIDGILLSGIVGKNHVGIAKDTIIQQLILDYGDQRAADFITDIYFLLTRYLTRRGFSAGYKDILTDDNIINFIDQELQQMDEAIAIMNTEVTNDIEKKYVENRIIDTITQYTEKLYKYNKDNTDASNRFVMMIDSGAKGKNAEFGSITAFVGQAYSGGSRIKLQLTNGTRSSIYFEPGDNSAPARGFIMNSYREGLTPVEVQFNQSKARDDIVKMMTGTPKTGWLNHQMARSNENMKTRDGKVVNPNGKLVSLLYGGDGMNADRMTSVTGPMGNKNTFVNLQRLVGNLNNKYGYTNTNPIGVREDVEYRETEEIETPEYEY